MIRHNILNNADIAERYIEGVQQLKDLNASPWPGQAGLSMYDFFVFWHHRAMMLPTPPTQRDRNAAHTGPVFLPWHRYMLLMLEFYLRDSVGDDFRMPYWNWAEDAEMAQPNQSSLWGINLLGRFTAPNWRVRLEPNPPGRNPIVTDRELTRQLGRGGRLSRRTELRSLVRDMTIYDERPYNLSGGRFRNNLEGWEGVGHHNAVHMWVGGDMTSSTSPNDPTFFLVHCNVDRVWSAWTNQHPNSQYVPGPNAPEDMLFHRLDDAMHTFFNHGFDVTPRMMLNHDEWYRYDAYADLM